MFGTLYPETRPCSYRHSFCGACQAMAEFSGKPSALLTSYDTAFLHLVMVGLEKATPRRRKPCTALPWRIVTISQLTPPGRRYLAAVNLVLGMFLDRGELNQLLAR